MTELIIMMFVFFLSFLIGYLFISKVPQLLHTPLMSMTNAISAVTIYWEHFFSFLSKQLLSRK